MKAVRSLGLFAALLGLVMGAPGSSRAAEGPIHIGLVMNDSNASLVPQAALKLGFFDKAGVKVTIDGYSGGSTAMEAVATGNADFAVFTPEGVSMAAKHGIKAKVVAVTILNHHDWKVYVKKDSPYTTLAQLANKKIGITASGSSTDFLALWAAHHAGITIIRVPVGGAGLVPNLLSGTVDAIISFPQVSYDLEKTGDARALFDFGSFPSNSEMGQVVQSCWVASDKAIDGNPDGVRKVLVGVFSAAAYLKQHPDEAYPFIEKQMRVDLATAKKEYADAILAYSPDGAATPASIQASLSLLKLAGLTDMPGSAAVYTDKFVPVKLITR